MEKDEFLHSYRNITSNLRRRFQRRPNASEAIDSYGSLSKQQIDHGFVETGAACLLASAHLEQALNLSSGNTSKTEEHSHYLSAAREYSRCEREASKTANLTGITCYEAAINSAPDEHVSFMTAVQAGSRALSDEDFSSAVQFFRKALTVARGEVGSTAARKMLVNAYVHQDAFIEAFEVASEYKGQDSLMQVTTLFLAILLQRLWLTRGNARLSKLCENTVERAISVVPREFNLLVDSLVATAGEVTMQIPRDLWKFVSYEQQQLLFLLNET